MTTARAMTPGPLLSVTCGVGDGRVEPSPTTRGGTYSLTSTTAYMPLAACGIPSAMSGKKQSIA